MNQNHKLVASKTLSGSKLPARDILMLADDHGNPIMEPPVADLGFSTPENEVFARRLALCWNFCGHYPDDALADGDLTSVLQIAVARAETWHKMIAACKAAMLHIQTELHDEEWEGREGKACKLHDQLLEALNLADTK